jgi:hypothetical protein
VRTFAAGLLIAAVAIAACNKSNPSGPSNGNALTMMSGTWRSASTATSVGPCNNITYTLTPTGTTTATVTYTATCVGVPVSGTGSGTMNGTTFNWMTSGTTGSCSYSLNGTATPASAADLNVSYGGTVCGVAVSGSETLHR